MDDPQPATKADLRVSIEDLKSAMLSLKNEVLDAMHEFETNLVNEFRRCAKDQNGN